MIQKSDRIFILILAAAALAAMGLVFYATSHGAGVGGDATIYLTSAKNLIEGRGLGWTEADGSFRLLPYTPPFYPLALAGIGLLGEMLNGARLVNILLSGVLAAVLGWSFWRFTSRAWLAAVLAGLVAFSPVLLGVQVWAMSETLFLFLGFTGLVTTLLYLETCRRRWLVASAVLLGLAFLTRYMGLAFVAAGGLAVLFLPRESSRQFTWRVGRPALVDTFWFGLLAVLPILAWLVVDFSITGTVGSRSAQPAAMYWQRFLDMGPALQNIYLFWLVPESAAGRLPGPVQSLAWLLPLILLVVLAVVIARRLKNPSGSANEVASLDHRVLASSIRLAVLFGLFIVVYLLVLAVAQVFTFPPITLASRMLSPVHLAVLVLVCALAHLALVAGGAARRLVWIVVLFGLLAFMSSYALRSVLIAREYHRTGIGYNEVSWSSSATIAALRQLPADVPLISNEVTAIMYLAGRPAYALQEIYQTQPSSEPFLAYGEGEDTAQQVFRGQNGALVLFSANLGSDFSMYGDRAQQRLQALTSGLYPYFLGEDGAIYFYRQPDFDLPDS